MSNHSFTLRHRVSRNVDGAVCQEEFFYLNDDPYAAALEDVLHCFAFGISSWGKGFSIRKECCSYISFNFFLDGDAEIDYEHRRLHAVAGDLLVAQFRNSFSVRTGPAGHVRKLCLLLSYTPIQSAICRLLCPEDLTLAHMPFPDRVRDILETIARNVKGGCSDRELSLSLMNFLLEIREQLTIPPRQPEPVAEAVRFLTAAGSGGVGRRELAEHCAVSLSTLTRLFRSYLGCSPGQYIIRRKLELAARLLMLNRDSVKSIAYECGFSSSMFFAREFKQHYGVTPSEFRRRQIFSLPEK